MNRLVLCDPVSSASFWIYVVLAVVGLALFVLFFVRAVRSPAAGGEGSVTIDIKARVAKLRGPALYLLLALVALAVIPMFPSIDHKLGLGLTQYPQSVDLKAGETLGALRQKFERYSGRGIVLQDGAEDMRVEGAFEGACVADMFYAICLRNTEALSCSWPNDDRIMYVKKNTRP